MPSSGGLQQFQLPSRKMTSLGSANSQAKHLLSGLLQSLEAFLFSLSSATLGCEMIRAVRLIKPKPNFRATCFSEACFNRRCLRCRGCENLVPHLAKEQKTPHFPTAFKRPEPAQTSTVSMRRHGSHGVTSSKNSSESRSQRPLGSMLHSMASCPVALKLWPESLESRLVCFPGYTVYALRSGNGC